MRNFIGQDGFVWWIGVVESTNDPLTLGRCKVRCFGYHPAKSTNLVPTEDLPWALSIHPANTPNLYACPRIGDWVFGFFLDSLSAQEPAILGYLPAIPQAAAEYFGATGSTTRSFKNVSVKDDIFWEINKAIFRIDAESNMRFEVDKNIFLAANNDVRIKSNSDIYATAYNNVTFIGADLKSSMKIDKDGTVTLESTNKDILLRADKKLSIIAGGNAGSIEISDDGTTKIESEKDFTVIADNLNVQVKKDSTITSENVISIESGEEFSITGGADVSISAGGDLSFADSANTTTLHEILSRIGLLEYRLDHATKSSVPNTDFVVITNI